MEVKIIQKQLPITSLCFLNSKLLLAGLGSSLLLYTCDETSKLGPKKLISEWKLFDHARIHRIISFPCPGNDDNVSFILLLCAGKETARVEVHVKVDSDLGSLSFQACLSNIQVYSWSQWILDACIVDQSTLAFISAYNTIYLAEIYSSGELQKKSTIEPDEKPLLWSASFSQTYYTSKDQMAVVSGTVMLEILIWSPGVGTQISHRLTGHKGTIFSVSFSPSKKQIASVSDDRTLRIWQLDPCSDNVVDPCKILWGHQGRAWRCVWVDENSILTTGEDTRAFYWSASEDFKPRQLGVEHDGHGLWSIAHDENSRLVVTGGADGCIQLIDMNPPESDSIQSPKTFDIMDDEKIITSDTEGNISILNPVSNEQIEIYHDARFSKNSCRINAIPGSKSALIVNNNGSGVILDLSDLSNITCKTVDFNISVLSVYIMNCKDFHLLQIYDRKLNCINIFRIHKNSNEIDFHSRKVFQLEPQWGHVLCACSSFDGTHIFVGTRNGFIIALHYNNKEQDNTSDNADVYLKAYAMVHDQGLRDVRIYSSDGDEGYDVETIGRDGYLIRACLKNNEFITRHAQHFSRGWLEKFVNVNGLPCIAYFNSAKFFLANKHGETIAQFSCPSVPPNWAVLPSENSISLYIITSRGVRVHKTPVDIHASIRNRGHGREVRDTDVYALAENKWLLASGSEDAILRISLVNQSGELKTLYRSTTMDAAIKSISWFKDEKSNLLYLFVSAACMKLTCFQVSIRPDDGLDVCVLCEAPIIDDPETRVMECQIVNRNENVLLVAGACSNGNLWTWKLKNNFRHFSDASNLTALQKAKRCILSLKAVEIEGYVYFLAGSTNGRVAVWDSYSSSGIPILEFKAHQSGVNKIDVCSTSPDILTIATGGDDNAITLTVLRVSRSENNEGINIQVIHSWSVANAHYCAIQGLQFIGTDTLVSFGIDQRIRFWKVSQEELKLEEKETIMSEVADGSSLCYRQSRSGEDSIIVTAGIGIEVWRL